MNPTSFPMQPLGAFGNYRLLRKIARGGMAEIFLAVLKGKAGFEKVVVLKRVLPELSESDEFIQIFLDEARLAARLDHPNIGRVYDLGEVGGQYYLSMEYLAGEDLASVIQLCRRSEKAPSIEIAAEIVLAVCEGLHFAHSAADAMGKSLGIVHRDVSPSNVVVTYSGQVKLIDFGIARAEGNLIRTGGAKPKGKVQYMAPEQAAGGKSDLRSDVFSVGILLHELLTTNRLFRRDSDEATLRAVLSAEAAAPSKTRPDVPASLDRICARALARDPAARYQSAEQLAAELRTVLQSRSSGRATQLISTFMGSLFPAERRQKKMRISHGGPLPEEGPDLTPVSSFDGLTPIRTNPNGPRPSRPSAPPVKPMQEVPWDVPAEAEPTIVIGDLGPQMAGIKVEISGPDLTPVRPGPISLPEVKADEWSVKTQIEPGFSEPVPEPSRSRPGSLRSRVPAPEPEPAPDDWSPKTLLGDPLGVPLGEPEPAPPPAVAAAASAPSAPRAPVVPPPAPPVAAPPPRASVAAPPGVAAAAPVAARARPAAEAGDDFELKPTKRKLGWIFALAGIVAAGVVGAIWIGAPAPTPDPTPADPPAAVVALAPEVVAPIVAVAEVAGADAGAPEVAAPVVAVAEVPVPEVPVDVPPVPVKGGPAIIVGMLRFAPLPAGTKVTLDGEAISRLEVDRYLSPGPHKLAVVAPGYLPLDLDVAISAGQLQVVAPKLHRLPPAKGTVEVICNPWCEITLDGKPTGKNSPSRLSLPTGPHKFRLGNPTLGLSKEAEVKVEANGFHRIEVTLTP